MWEVGGGAHLSFFTPILLGFWVAEKRCVCACVRAHMHAYMRVANRDGYSGTDCNLCSWELEARTLLWPQSQTDYNRRPYLTKNKRKKKAKTYCWQQMAKQALFTYKNYTLLVAALFSLLRWGSVGPHRVLHRRGHHSQSSWAVGRQR